MQSGGSGGGPARNPGMGPAGRTNSTSSAASPTSSSSSVQQQQQQQQLASRQQQQQGRNSEANDGMFAYHPGGVQGMMGGGNFGSSSGSMQQPQQPRRLFDSPQQQQGSSQEGQQSFNPMQQAYLQFALQAQQQKAQQQARMGMMGSSKDQDARMGMLNMQGAMPMQASNQAQGSSSNPSAEQFARGERQMESGHETKPHPQQVGTGQLMPGNITRPMQAPQGPQGVSRSQLACCCISQTRAHKRVSLSIPHSTT